MPEPERAANGFFALMRLGPVVGVALAFAGISPAAASVSKDTLSVRALLEREAGSELREHAAFLEGGQVLEVPLVESTTSRCGVAIIIADRRVGVEAVAAPPTDEVGDGLEFEPSDRGVRSFAVSENGFVVVDACGEPVPVGRVLIRMASPRGALTVVTVSLPRGETGRVSEALARDLDRVDGPSAKRADLGPPLAAGSFGARKARGRQRAFARGATNVLSTEGTADPAGEGALAITLTRGCHTLRVMSAESLPRDIDAELWDADLERRLSRDRSDLPDAHLAACVSEKAAVQVSWKGASPSGRVVVEDEITPIGEGVPTTFGSQAETSLARLFHEREAPMPAVQPFFTALGAQGATELSAAVEPGRCYVAALAVSRGAARGLRLSAGDSARPSLVEVPRGVDAASVQFCARTDATPIYVDVPGGSITWLLSVWLVGARPIDASLPATALISREGP